MSMKKIFLFLLTISVLLVSSCSNEQKTHESSEEVYSSHKSSEEVYSSHKSSEEVFTKNISYSPIYGEYNDETFLKKDDFISILRENGINHYIEETSDEGFLRLSYVVSEENVANVEIYNSVDDAKKNYYTLFSVEDGNIKSSLIIFLFESAIRVGNVIVFGNDKAINPICNYFNIEVVEKSCIYEGGLVEYDYSINISEIESYMKEKGFTQYDSQSSKGEVYKVFVNFNTNDCVSIIKCETAEKANDKAKSILLLDNPPSVGCVCTCLNDFVFISRGDTWENLGLTEGGFNPTEE